MGTNYYHRYNECEHCGRYDSEHIGKSSVGWRFSFHGRKKKYDDDPPSITSWQEWRSLLEAGGRIFNEYGEEVPLAEFITLVEAKQCAVNKDHALFMVQQDPRFASCCWHDDEGYSFDEGEFS